MDRRNAARIRSTHGLASVGILLLAACGSGPTGSPAATPPPQAPLGTAQPSACATPLETAFGALVLVEEGSLIVQSWDGERCVLAEVEDGGAIWAAPHGRALAWLAAGYLMTLDLSSGESSETAIGGDLEDASLAVEWTGDRIAIVGQDWIDPGIGMPEPAGQWDLSLLRRGAVAPELLYHGPVAAFPCLGECPDTAPLDVGQMGWAFDGGLVISVWQFLAPAVPALQAVWVIDAETLDSERVLEATQFGEAAIFSGGAELSPDGAMIAYLPPSTVAAVEVRNLSSDDLIRIDMPPEVGMPVPDTLSWSVDSRRLGFLALDWTNEGRQEGIAVLDLETKLVRLLVEDPDVRPLVWCGSKWLLRRSGENVTAGSLAGAEMTWTLAEGSRLVSCIPPD